MSGDAHFRDRSGDGGFRPRVVSSGCRVIGTRRRLVMLGIARRRVHGTVLRECRLCREQAEGRYEPDRHEHDRQNP